MVEEQKTSDNTYIIFLVAIALGISTILIFSEMKKLRTRIEQLEKQYEVRNIP